MIRCFSSIELSTKNGTPIEYRFWVVHADPFKHKWILPFGWSQHFDKTGRLYYQNHNTKTTHWELPEDASHPIAYDDVEIQARKLPPDTNPDLISPWRERQIDTSESFEQMYQSERLLQSFSHLFGSFFDTQNSSAAFEGDPEPYTKK